MYTIISALGGEFIKNKLEEAKYKVIGDIDNQENLFKCLNKKSHNVLILSDSLVGFYSKYGLIKKIRSINKKIKIIVILEEKDEKFEMYLQENEIEDFFDNGNFTLEDIISRLDEYEESKNFQRIFLKTDNKVDEKESVKSIIVEFLEKNEIPYSIIKNDGIKKICIDLNCEQQTCKSKYYYTPLIVLTSNKDVCKVYPYEIMHIAIEDRESVLYLIDEKTIRTNYRISYWDNILSKEYFARPHNSFIVNLNYVREVTRDFVFLKYNKNEYLIYTSKRKIPAFKKAFLNFGKLK